MNTPEMRKTERPGIGGKWISAITLYIAAVIALLVSLYSFKEDRPHIKGISINSPSTFLEITGENLDSDIRASLLFQDSTCSNVVAKKFMWERVFDVKVKGSIAWALCRNVGLIALDISNPQQPEILRTIHINKFLWHLKIDGDTAYIACGSDGIVACDVSSPEEAKILYSHKLPYISIDITAAHDLVYVCNNMKGSSANKKAISVLEPETQEIVSNINLPGRPLRVHATRDRLFILSKHEKQGLLHIYAIDETPAQPKKLQQLKLDGIPRDYALKDNRLFLAIGNAGVGIVDLHESSAATFVKSLDTSIRADRLALSGEQLAVFGRAGSIALYSMDSAGRMKLTSTTDSCSRIFGADIFAHYAVLASNIDGVNIVDLRPHHKLHDDLVIAEFPSRVETINWHVTSSGIAIREAEKLYYLNMKDSRLKLTGELTYPLSEFSNVFSAYNIYDSRIYAAFKDSGLHVARIAPDGTLEPGEIVAFPKGQKFRIRAIEGHKDNLYLCTNDGLKVFDISNPDHPVYLPDLDIPGDMRSIAFGGGFAYIANYGEGIKISSLNHNGKLGPAETIDFPGHLIAGGKSLDIIYSDGFLFAACGYRGLLSIDVRKPHQPVVMSSIELSGYCNRVELNQGFLGAMSHDSAYLFDAQNPEQLRMLGKVDNIKGFHLGNDGLLTLQPKRILRTPPPMNLQLTQSSDTRLIFKLPADIPHGNYNLFLNLNDKRSQLTGTLKNIPNKTDTSRWELIQH
ncbi:MAG: hypothetical protein R6V18_08760 [Desulfuromonadaceae bacterium]